MMRRRLNASRLQQEVSRRIQRVQEVVDEGVRIGVPRPQLQAPDADGCNWTMKHFGNAAGFETAIADVLAQVRAEYNLADDADEPATQQGSGTSATAANPFGDSEREPAAAANPFGAAKPRERVNPFGDANSSKAGDPFGASEADASRKPPPRDPFGSN
jgi:hypothetical protein